MNKKGLLTYSGLVFAMLFWGFSFIWFKQANEYFPPLTIIFFRLFISSALLISFSWIKGLFQKINRKEAFYFLLLSLFNPFFYFIGESFGLTKVSSTTAAVMIATIPVFIPFAAHLFYKEQLSPLNFAGGIISFIGVLFIIFQKDLRIVASTTGILFLSFAVLSAVVYTILLRGISPKFKPVFIITIQNSLGTILFLPLFIIMDFKEIREIPIRLNNLAPIFELAIFASSIAFIFYANGIQKIGAGKASIFTNTIPVFTAVFSFIILGDMLTIQIMSGIIIVIAGLLLSQMTGIKKSKFRGN